MLWWHGENSEMNQPDPYPRYPVYTCLRTPLALRDGERCICQSYFQGHSVDTVPAKLSSKLGVSIHLFIYEIHLTRKALLSRACINYPTDTSHNSMASTVIYVLQMRERVQKGEVTGLRPYRQRVLELGIEPIPWTPKSEVQPLCTAFGTSMMRKDDWGRGCLGDLGSRGDLGTSCPMGTCERADVVWRAMGSALGCQKS